MSLIRLACIFRWRWTLRLNTGKSKEKYFEQINQYRHGCIYQATSILKKFKVDLESKKTQLSKMSEKWKEICLSEDTSANEDDIENDLKDIEALMRQLIKILRKSWA